MQGKELAICRGHEHWVESVYVMNDAKIVTGSGDRTVRVWDMQGKLVARCTGHEDSVLSVCVTNDGKIVSGSKNKTGDMQGNELTICRGHDRVVYSVCVTANGKIVFGAYDKTIRVCHIGLLGRIVRMDEDQARALWELLQSISKKAEIGKQELWKEIEKILGEDTPVVQAKINNNNNE